MNEELAVYDLTTKPILPPKQQVEEAREKAVILKDIVEQAGLAKSLGGQKKHLEFEAWQTIATFHGCTSIVDWTRLIEYENKPIGYEARVNIVNSENRIISSAEAMCTRGEANWEKKPMFQLRSMAQTRAASKACRMVFSWVVVLAGYSATPFEEMTEEHNGKSEIQEPQKKKEESESYSPEAMKKVITEPQRKRFWGIAKESGKTEDYIKEYLLKQGFVNSGANIPYGRYDEVVAWAQTKEEPERQPGEDG